MLFTQAHLNSFIQNSLLFCWAYFQGSLFFFIARNFAFQNGFGLSIAMDKNIKITASLYENSGQDTSKIAARQISRTQARQK